MLETEGLSESPDRRYHLDPPACETFVPLLIYSPPLHKTLQQEGHRANESTTHSLLLEVPVQFSPTQYHKQTTSGIFIHLFNGFAFKDK